MKTKGRSILAIVLILTNILVGIFAYLVYRPSLLDKFANNKIFNSSYSFAEPLMLLLLLSIPLLSIYYFLRNNKNESHIAFSKNSILKDIPKDIKEYLRHIPFLIRILALSFVIIGLARPQSNMSWEDSDTEGIDIVITMDVSFSMLAKDFPDNRLEAAKKVAIDFIDDRPNDRIGLVIYEGESFTQVPLTTDHRVIKEVFYSLEPGMLEGGTAIGMGLATAVKRLKDSNARSKVVILLTDGVNNTGNIQPTDAADLAKQFGIRVYTIGIGSLGTALFPVSTYPNGSYKYERIKVEIDEKTLQNISDKTDGKYFRAKNMKTLEDIYSEIDQMEKTIIKVTEHRKKTEQYYYFVLIGFVLLIMELIISHLYIRKSLI